MAESVIEFKNVTLSFQPGTPPELAGVSFHIKEGEIVSLVGPSGCGKSTLLRLICGVLAPEEGIIKVYGKKAVPGWSGLGFVPQDPLLFPWRTVLANVRLPLEINAGGEIDEEELNRQARELLQLVNLNGVEDKYPHQLSGGMKQRAALARGLAADTRILLLDEPFAALDTITRIQLHLELLRIQSRTGNTVLLVTHDIFEAVFLSHRVVVMGENPGRILGEVIVDLDFPRNPKMMGTPEFSRLVGEVQDILEQGWRRD